MSKKSYSEKLKDPRWQKKRLEVLEAGRWQCRKCWSKDKELHVHHLVYDKGAQPWEYENRDLIVLCANCHKDAEDREALRLFRHYMATTVHTVEEVRQIAGMIEAIGGDEFGIKGQTPTASLILALMADASASDFRKGWDEGHNVGFQVATHENQNRKA